MKSILSLTLCLALTFILCMPARASPDTAEYRGDTRTFHTTKSSVWVFIRGDPNGDGKLNVRDVLVGRSHILHITQLDAIHKLAADANKDRKFNVSDVLRIIATLLRKQTMNW